MCPQRRLARSINILSLHFLPVPHSVVLSALQCHAGSSRPACRGRERRGSTLPELASSQRPWKWSSTRLPEVERATTPFCGVTAQKTAHTNKQNPQIYTTREVWSRKISPGKVWKSPRLYKTFILKLIFFPLFLGTIPCCAPNKNVSALLKAQTKRGPGHTSVSFETKACLWAPLTPAHESRHLLEKLFRETL